MTANQNGLFHLSIANPNKMDSGEYLCEIELPGQSTKSTSHTVTVEPSVAAPMPEERLKRRHQQQQPKRDHATDVPNAREHAPSIALASFMKNITIEEGGRAKFVCSVVGNAEFSVEWFKNNMPLQPELDHRYQITTSDAIIGLQIQNVVTSDSGFYTCTIKGQRNSVTSSSKLTVYEAYKPGSRKKSHTSDRPPTSLPFSAFIGKGKTSHSPNKAIKLIEN